MPSSPRVFLLSILAPKWAASTLTCVPKYHSYTFHIKIPTQHVSVQRRRCRHARRSDWRPELYVHYEQQRSLKENSRTCPASFLSLTDTLSGSTWGWWSLSRSTRSGLGLSPIWLLLPLLDGAICLLERKYSLTVQNREDSFFYPSCGRRWTPICCRLRDIKTNALRGETAPVTSELQGSF